ncbi:MAG: hypothetical protein BWY57_03282 [Betaproteobacteria bacterium ADurb.Bin341]|nr:MAG: hypothetical protein BWY57_03282 [Betaproteobacteria bacterium ADurb.Bin341]
MTVYRLDITPLAPLHRGIHGHAAKSGAVVHSDTLHAALVSSAAAAGASPDELERFRTLRVSSLFPSLGKAPLYPKPFLPLPKTGEQRKAADDPKAAKRWKQVRLVSEKVLNAWLLGKQEEVEAAVLRDGVASFEKEFPESDWPRHGLVTMQRQTGVVVDRDNAAATPYDRNLVWVNKDEGVGLYCFVEAGDKDGPWLAEAFERLGYAGLGGNRTSGFGAFNLAGCAPADWPALNCANMFMTLSLYLPTYEEVQASVLEKPAAYDCVLRGGWIHGVAGTGHTKHALRMCLEGSVFNKIAESHGEVRDVRHDGDPVPAWRSGLALAIPFFLNLTSKSYSEF